ncbi:MAG: FAD-dependent oxidoreductase, partial [Candidatus Diapherotrites archaeon]|nr:FAD-dependent oxidoreductase [Candidatus Diapherotrites archaeon]
MHKKKNLVGRTCITAASFKGKKVAIIGSGPAGMHAALLLAQQGFAVELFEREKQLGGMLRYCIPKFRFGRQGIDQKIEKLREAGVKIHAGKAVGNKLPLQEIVESFDAVLLACGEQKEKRLGIQGESLKGVSYWSVFLREYNENRAKKMDGKRAVVLGGGDTAIDCARVAKRLGTEAVIAYRRSREGMPAEKREIE